VNYIFNFISNDLFLVAWTTNAVSVDSDLSWKLFVFLAVELKTLFEKILNN